MRHRHLVVYLFASAAGSLAGCGSGSDEAAPGGVLAVSATDGGAVDAASARPLTSFLVADVNRNGTIDETDPTELAGRDTWDDKHGAVFLANVDDDLKACKTSGQTDVQLDACNDAADDVVNGADDLEDLAEIHLTAWKDMPEGASATMALDEKSAPNVRLFKKVGDAYEVLDLAVPFTADELRGGLELRIEGKDIARDLAVWDGTVDVALTLKKGDVDVAVDKLRLRMAPVISPNHLEEPTMVFAAKGDSLSTSFLTAISAVTRAVPAKGVPAAVGLSSGTDIWTQDYWDPAYTSMPGKDGTVHALRLNFRSANYGRMWSSNGSNALRPGGRAAYSLRGKDVGVVVAYDPKHDDNMDSENSFGNMETLPPYTNGDAKFPLGRIVRGSFSTNYPDRVFDKMLEAQRVQGPVLYVNTSWLIVGHIDEVLSFVKVSSPRGWAVLLADPTAARAAYQKLQDNGQGALPVHEGKSVYDAAGENYLSAQTTVARILADTDLMAANQAAQGYIDAIVAKLKSEVGLADSEFIRVPFFIEHQEGLSVAFDPGTVNGISLGAGHFIAPDPHGAAPGGADVLKTAFEQALAPLGITTHWVENWDLLHRNYGEVHCGSNVYRVVPANNGFWTSGK